MVQQRMQSVAYSRGEMHIYRNYIYVNVYFVVSNSK